MTKFIFYVFVNSKLNKKVLSCTFNRLKKIKMKNYLLITVLSLSLLSCGSTYNFNNFFNAHKADLGVTAFQIPNFIKAMVAVTAPETNQIIAGIADVKFIKFKDVSNAKRQLLVQEMNMVSNAGYTDMYRENLVDRSKIISVKEIGSMVTHAVIFNSNKEDATAFYLKGRFDPLQIKALSDDATFNKFSTNLLSNYQQTLSPSYNPGFNPNAKD